MFVSRGKTSDDTERRLQSCSIVTSFDRLLRITSKIFGADKDRNELGAGCLFASATARPAIDPTYPFGKMASLTSRCDCHVRLASSEFPRAHQESVHASSSSSLTN